MTPYNIIYLLLKRIDKISVFIASNFQVIMNNELKKKSNDPKITELQAPSRHLSGKANQDPNTCLNILSPDRDLNWGPTE
jgi:hypothetical protein